MTLVGAGAALVNLTWGAGRRRGRGRSTAASLIELVYVAEKRSDSIDAETPGLVLDVVEEPSSPISLSALSVDVARAMVEIPGVHVRDPFDRAIVATARAAGLRPVTREASADEVLPGVVPVVSCRCRWVSGPVPAFGGLEL